MTALLKTLTSLAHERHGLGEDHSHNRADLLGLFRGCSLNIHPVDGGDRHVDSELNRVVSCRERLLTLYLLSELRHATLEFLITEEISEVSFHGLDASHHGVAWMRFGERISDA